MSERTVVTSSQEGDQPADEPFLQVVRGSVTPEEIAALVAVFLARASAPTSRPASRPRSAWGDPAGVLRRRAGHRGARNGSRRLPHT